MSYIELHLHTFTLSNLQCSQLSVLSQEPSTSCHNKVYSQPCYRKPSLPYFLHLHRFSSVTIFLSHFPLCLIFIIPLPPCRISPSLSFICIFCSYISSLPSWWWSRGPDLVVLGFQMVWLADGSELTSRQLILSYLKPPGVLWEGRHFSSKLRGRGQERDRGLWENCITAEPVIYCISSSNSLRLGFFLVLFFQSACTSELFEAQAHTLCYHSSAV